MIQYHLGDRDGLFTAVIETAHQEFQASVDAVRLPTTGTTRERVSALVDAAWRAFSAPTSMASLEISLATRPDRSHSLDARLADTAAGLHQLGAHLTGRPDDRLGDLLWAAPRGMAHSQMIAVSSGRHDQQALSHHRPPPPPSPPPRVTTGRPRKTSVSLLQGCEATNRDTKPVEATPPRTSSATTPDCHHGQRDSPGEPGREPETHQKQPRSLLGRPPSGTTRCDPSRDDQRHVQLGVTVGLIATPRADPSSPAPTALTRRSPRPPLPRRPRTHPHPARPRIHPPLRHHTDQPQHPAHRRPRRRLHDPRPPRRPHPAEGEPRTVGPAGSPARSGRPARSGCRRGGRTIEGVDANASWSHLRHVARELDVPGHSTETATDSPVMRIVLKTPAATPALRVGTAPTAALSTTPNASPTPAPKGTSGTAATSWRGTSWPPP
ncbi:hypothetical protein FAIPA1_400042 [Frankia sp. AiPs1]